MQEELESAAEFSSTRLEDFNRLSYEYERRRAEREAKQVSFQNKANNSLSRMSVCVETSGIAKLMP